MPITTRRKAVTALLATLIVPTCLLAGDLDNLFQLREARTRRVSSAKPDWRNANADSHPIEPGTTLTVADIKGPGIIRHIWFTIACPDPAYTRMLVLRMYWDDSDQPAVESPLGDFFAVGHGLRKDVNSLMVAVSAEGRAMNCYWPMPFAKRARITLTNDSKLRVRSAYFYIDYEEVDGLPSNTACFHAQYRQEYPATMGQDYLILDAEGRGHYVGTVLSVRTRTQGWFGEGDDRFFIDGDTEPTLRGTGTEDYFCDAWGFREFNRPYYGVVMGTGRILGENVTAYRWHVNDPVHFQKSLKVSIEHKGVMRNDRGKGVSGFMERPDLFSSVAYWYQTGTAKRFAMIPPAGERIVQRRLIELEAGKAQVTAEPANTLVEVQRGRYSGEHQILARFEAEGGALTIPFQLEQAVKGFARLRLTRAKNYGIWRVSLDGKPLPGMDSVDLFAPAVGPAEFDIGAVDLAEGKHELKLECRGKNRVSQGHFLGVDALEIEELTPYVLKSE